MAPARNTMFAKNLTLFRRTKALEGQIDDFLDGLAKGEPSGPTFRDALETQKVCDTVLVSAKEKQWREVK